MVSFWNFLLNIFGIITASLIILIVYFKKRYSHWKNLGIEYLEPTFPFGNVGDTFKQKVSTGEFFQKFYSIMRSRKVQHAGIYFFHKPIYVPIDLDLIKHILQIDFAHFTDRGAYVNERDDPLSAHLTSLNGQKWKNLRAKLTPTFTSGKMKNMFPIMVKVSQELIKVLEKEFESGQPIDAKDISARLTTDIIGNCGFGIECNSLHDPNTEFRIYGKRVFDLTRRESISNFLSLLYPNAMRVLRVRLFPKVATDFFLKVIKETTDYREQNGVRRNDALQLLLDMKNNEGKESDTTLTFNELAAQAFVFFVGGFETTSTVLSFALMELALNEDIQDTLRNEINTVLQRNNNEFTYEALAEMKYLDMVINETLRMYAPAPIVGRVCTQDYRVPNSDILIKKDDMIFVPIQGIHYDPEYYPNPQKFDPTRFNYENKSKRHQFAFMPFGEGQRVCIAVRFAILEVRVGLSAIIKNFKIKINPKTELPVKMDPVKFFTSSIGKLWIDLEKIN